MCSEGFLFIGQRLSFNLPQAMSVPQIWKAALELPPLGLGFFSALTWDKSPPLRQFSSLVKMKIVSARRVLRRLKIKPRRGKHLRLIN